MWRPAAAAPHPTINSSGDLRLKKIIGAKFLQCTYPEHREVWKGVLENGYLQASDPSPTCRIENKCLFGSLLCYS